MSLPQTECSVPFGEQSNRIVCPSAWFSDVAVVSQAVGFAGPPADVPGDAGLELASATSVCTPPPVFVLLLSFFSFEQPALTTTMMVTKSATQRPGCCRGSRVV